MNAAVRLREIEDGDLATFFEHQREPEAVWMAAFTASNPEDRAAFDAHWLRIRTSDDIVARAIVSNDAVVGHISMYMSEAGRHEISYWIGSAYWGQGIATAALSAFIANEATVRPLYAWVAADNPRSTRVLEACGFVRYTSQSSYANARGTETLEYAYELNDPAEKPDRARR